MTQRDRETTELFVEESREGLQRMEALLLAAERGAPPPEMIATLFRDMHTIKGTSGFLHLDKIRGLSHVAEDVLGQLRDNALAPSPALYALLVSAVDALRAMIDCVMEIDEEGDTDVEPLRQKLHAVAEGADAEDVVGASAPAAPQAASGGANLAPLTPAPVVAAPVAAPVSPAPVAAPVSPAPVAAPVSPAPVAAPVAAPPVSPAPVARAPAAPARAPAAPARAPAPPAAPATVVPPPKLGEILVDGGFVSHDELAAALEYQKSPTPPAPRTEAESTVRVQVGVLDNLMNLMGELVLARNQMVQLVRHNVGANPQAQAAIQRLSHVTTELQEQVMKTRMQPVARVFEKLPRMVRDLAHATGKQVNVNIQDAATEIDKALVEAIRDPLMHIVRNAVDHGIETPDVRVAHRKPAAGRVDVRAGHEGGMVAITVQDDGGGMNPEVLRAHAVKKGVITQAAADALSDREALELVFRPGFSTAAKVTDISGRGVGMDVVRTHVQRAGGKVELESQVGRGTTIRLKMPLTLAIIPALLVRVGVHRFAIPQVNLHELVYLDEEQTRGGIEMLRGVPIHRLRGQLLPLVRLGQLLNLSGDTIADAGTNIVVVGTGEQRYGLVVDEVQDTEEIVVKPLEGDLRSIRTYAGATVLGDGGIALILDAAGLARTAGIESSPRAPVRRPAAAATGLPTTAHLVFLAGAGQQCAVPLSTIARLDTVRRGAIESVAGKEMLQYHGGIIPIVRPEKVLPLGESPLSDEEHLIVFDFGHPLALAVSAILDVVQLAVDPVEAEGALQHTLGRAVVGERTTLILDVYAIVRTLVPEFVREKKRRTIHQGRVLLADDSMAMRSSMMTFLRASGVDVVEAQGGDEAIRSLVDKPPRYFDAVVTDLEMASGDGMAVIEAVRRDRPETPVIVWTFHEDHRVSARVREAGARACVHKLRREDLVVELAKLGVVVESPQTRVT